MKHEDIKNILFKIEISRRNFLRPYFIEIGLTVGQGQPRILRELYLSGPMNQRELADACFLDVTTMSRTIDRLVSAGLIVRESNPECRRSFIISLTDNGRKKAEDVIDIFAMADEVFCENISEEELESFCKTAQKIENNIICKASQKTE